MIAEDRNTTVLRAALTQVLGGEWKIGTDGSAAPPPPPSDDPHQPAPPAAEPDPRDDADYEPSPQQRSAPVDPEAEAMKLLRDQLGARPLEG
jgi:DNA polymerase III subunit gamma/tau